MSLDKFCNVKMRVKPEQSERVQKAVFAAGGYWADSEKSTKNLESRYLYIGGDLDITCAHPKQASEFDFIAKGKRLVNPDTYAAELEAYVEQLKESKRQPEPRERQPVTPIDEQEPLEGWCDAGGASDENIEKQIKDAQRKPLSDVMKGQPASANSAAQLGRKDDQGKRQYSLVPTVAIGEVVDVLTFGAKKYQPDNWKHVDDARTRYYDAAMRHIQAWWRGESDDQESGFHHLAHAICCLMFLIWFDKND